MPSCPAPLTWKKILFCRFSRISRSSMRRDIYTMRKARIRSGASNRVGSSRSSGSVAALVSMNSPNQCSNGAATGAGETHGLGDASERVGKAHQRHYPAAQAGIVQLDQNVERDQQGADRIHLEAQ